MINISVFGPVHSGKSSLMGYIRAATMSDDDRYNAWTEIRKKLANQNISFSNNDKYTYFVSTDADDLIRNPSYDSIGSTKKMTIKNIGPLSIGSYEIDLNFIDTPGINTQKSWRDRYRGIFMGDIGVFVIDINQVAKLSKLEEDTSEYRELFIEQFSSLYYWKSIKPDQRVIIALAKCDSAHFENDIQNAINEIKSFDQFIGIPVVPTGIYFDTDNNYNIIGDCVTPKNINTNRFIDTLEYAIQETSTTSRYKQLSFGMVERKIHAKDTKEPVLRIKMLEGMISNGDEVIIAPVRRSTHQDFTKASFKIKSLKLEDSKFVNRFYSGDIGGVAFVRGEGDNVSISLSDLLLSPTTCILSGKTQYDIGTLICFKTNIYKDATFQQNFKRLNIHSQIQMIWLGKIINAELVSRYTIDNICHFSVVSKHHPIVVPKNTDGSYSINHFALVVGNSYFFQADLEHVGEISVDRFSEISDGPFSLYIVLDLTGLPYDKDEVEEQLGIKNVSARSELKKGVYTAWIDLNKKVYDTIAKQFSIFVRSNLVRTQVFCPINIDKADS